MALIDTYRVLPHRDIARLNDPLTLLPPYEHRPCGMPLSERDVVEANWCPHCAVVINKAAARRGKAHREGLAFRAFARIGG